jgi:hypothetical protein
VQFFSPMHFPVLRRMCAFLPFQNERSSVTSVFGKASVLVTKRIKGEYEKDRQSYIRLSASTTPETAEPVTKFLILGLNAGRSLVKEPAFLYHSNGPYFKN